MKYYYSIMLHLFHDSKKNAYIQSNVILSNNLNKFLVRHILPPFRILEKRHYAQNIVHTILPDTPCKWESGCPQCSHMLRMAISAVVCHLSPKPISLLVITAQTFGGNTIC